MTNHPDLPILRRALAALSLCLLPLSAHAGCSGNNLLAALPPAEAAALAAVTSAQPYATGNYWSARKDGREVHLLGTYHLTDPRHDALLAAVEPALKHAGQLLVEAGPEEERALKRDIATNPGLLFLTEGPSLMEQFGEEGWPELARALAARNIPAFMGAKMQPWYLATILAIPPCNMTGMTAGQGLDHRVMARAEEIGLPIRSLEPHDTVFRLFDRLGAEDQLSMLRSTLLMEPQIADYAATLADAYFAEDSRRMWEYLRITSRRAPGYTPERADTEFSRMEEELMSARNRAWIPVIEAAAADGPVFAAFGALHLAGEAGVLALLEAAGWQVERLSLRGADSQLPGVP
ncbi:MAG: TraB/GumN family protein [Gemmobacter sp.]|jgi:uncharacterized protein YbaP (TraB family)|nr:TraB/GumN family protein [Gemmobacter sp.]